MNEPRIGQIPGAFARSTGPSGVETSDRAARSTKRRLAFTLSILLSAVYALPFVERGWIPHDEGTIAQSAERVLSGELPHRDYDEGYTGGLTWAHALAFRVLGTRLTSLRWFLYVSFLFFVAAVAAIAVRLVSPGAAFLVTLLAVVWSVPNYFASLPSWYNLFFATFGALALLRHIESGRRIWLFLAGLCGGLSILIKVVGLYYVAACFLFIAYREQKASEESKTSLRGERRAFFVAKVLAAMALVGLLAALFVHPPLALRRFVHFVLPATSLLALLVVDEWRDGADRSRRFHRLGSLLAPFLAGVLIPVGLFLTPYVATGSLRSLLRDLFLLPQRQVGTATLPLRPMESLWLPIAAFVAIWQPRVFSQRVRRVVAGAFVVILFELVLLSSSSPAYLILWSAAQDLGVLTPIAAALLLFHRRKERTTLSGQQVFLFASLAAFLPLVQFPFSAAIYFCYAAPAVILAFVALAHSRPEGHAVPRLAVLVAFLAFAMLRMNPGYLSYLGWWGGRYVADGKLTLDRGGIRVPAMQAKEYGELIAAIERAPKGEIYATADCPEVYFLAGRRNPTRYFFDFLSDGYGHWEQTFRLLERRDIPAVVVNDRPEFSRAPDQEFLRLLATRYPQRRRIGHFTLFWRTEAPSRVISSTTAP